VAGAAASLLVTLTALAIRSWISSPPPTVTVVGPSGGNADRVEHSL
jgi:hypothetical protein